MMKKFLRTVLLAAAMLSLMSGCSLFATNTNDGGSGGSGGSSGGVKMTDSYTFEDPSGLDFDTRYVLLADESSQLISTADPSYGLVSSYSIIYAKEDAPVAGYDFFVCDSEEHTQTTVDLYAAMGQALTATETDPCVVYTSSDSDTLEAAMIAMQSYGLLKDTTVSAYVELMQAQSGSKLVE